jgi:hypothetical protein
VTVFFADGWPPWVRFQMRIKVAIMCAANEHDTTEHLLTDLQACELFLRNPRHSIEDLDSPVADELQDALAAHAAEDSFRYDDVCAANVVLASLNENAAAAGALDT